MDNATIVNQWSSFEIDIGKHCKVIFNHFSHRYIGKNKTKCERELNRENIWTLKYIQIFYEWHVNPDLLHV